MSFLHFEVFLVPNNSLFLFFSIRKFCSPFVDFFLFFLKIFKNYIFLNFFLKRIRCSKYKQGIVKEPNAKFAMLFLRNCDLLNVFNKYRNYAPQKNPRIQTFFFTFYISLPNFNGLGSIIKKKSKTESVPLIDNTKELIKKILSEQLHNQIIYAR